MINREKKAQTTTYGPVLPGKHIFKDILSYTRTYLVTI